MKNKSYSIVIISILVIIVIVLSFKLISEDRNNNDNIIVLKDIDKISSKDLELSINNNNKQIKDNNYLFLGDSITDFYDLEKYYPGLPVVNSGINGNSVYDILDNIKKCV